MPVGILIASVVGLILIIWLIKRSGAPQHVEFRQDTMRYIAIDPDKKKRNADLPPRSRQVAPQEAVGTSPGTEAERSGDETAEMEVASKLAQADEGHSESPETDHAAEPPFEPPELLVNDER